MAIKDEKADKAKEAARDREEDVEAEEAEPVKKMVVKAAGKLAKKRPDGGYPVALWERDPSHPDGEIWISGPGEVEVGVTPEVSRLLREGVLVEAKAAGK